jgi:hypothetical protein
MATLKQYIGINCAKYLIILGIKLNQIDENRSKFESLLSKQKRNLAKNFHPDVNKDGLKDMQNVTHFCYYFIIIANFFQLNLNFIK